MAPADALERLAADALMILLQIAAALGHVREGKTSAAVKVLTELAQEVPADASKPYACEALYWRARLGEAQGERDGIRSAAQDYVQLLSVLPEGRRRREVQVRLAALSEPGSVLTGEEARGASRRNLELIGLALHAFAADTGGALPDALFDLVGEYVTDPAVLVRPGRRSVGGARIYEYRRGLRADALRPQGAGGWEVPAVCLEPVAAPDGARLVLGLDGAVRSVQEKQSPR